MSPRNPSAVVIDWSSPEPAYAQIARQIRSRIASGDIGTGASLPSVRTLASDLGVNLNTVARAYRILDEEGFVEIRKRSGVRAAAPARRPDARETLESLQADLAALFARMRQAGLSHGEIRERAERAIAALAGVRGGKKSEEEGEVEP